MSEFDGLSREELQAISLEKNNKGTATARALKAQQILFELGGYSFRHYSDRVKSARDDYDYGEPNKFTKRFR